MANEYTWQNTRRRSTYRLPDRGHVGKFVLIAILVAIVMHLALYYFFGKVSWNIDFRESKDWESKQFAVEQVQIESDPELKQAQAEPLPEPEIDDVAYDEIDLMDAMDETQEVDILPDVEAPENIVIAAPALEGMPELDVERELIKAPDLTKDLPEMGDSENELREIPDGQLLVDEGDNDPELVDPDQWNKEQLAKGFKGGDPNGLLKNYSDIEDLLAKPFGSLGDGTKPARLGSDLLFDFDSAVLKDDAHLSLLKLGTLIAQQSKTYFILEGHTDTLGSASYNDKLGLQRAEAVRAWLISDLELNPDQILVRSAGSSNPILKDPEADRDAQAINRRVEIHMRKEIPADLIGNEAPKAQPVPVEPEPTPRRAEPVAPPADATEEPPRRARVVRPNRAIPVDPEPSRAVPVE